MSDSFEELAKIGQRARPACRVAYTLNNTQPVICTIIGDQPLFYMDFDIDYVDDEALFDAADQAAIKKEMESLKDSISGLDRISSSCARSAHEKVSEFLDDCDEITICRKKKEDPDINDLEIILSQSRLACAYIDFAAGHGVAMKYSGLVETAGYDRESGLILINPAIDETDRILLAARELRRHWQHRQGALINPLLFHPDSAVLVNRAQVADLAVSMIRIAWELQLSGKRQAWERIESSSLSDLGRAFAREAFLDFRTINNGQAASSVFESWFLSERCRAEDKNLISQMLADHKGYVFDLETARQGITPVLISALGSMPFGKNYLAEHAAIILDDPVFTDVRDRSNANFLWFIKFERSFRETEQELQTSAGPAAEGIHPSASPSETQDSTNETRQIATGQVVSLFRNDGAAATVDKSGHESGLLSRKGTDQRILEGKGVSNIVYLRRWSGE